MNKKYILFVDDEESQSDLFPKLFAFRSRVLTAIDALDGQGMQREAGHAPPPVARSILRPCLPA